MGRFIVVVLDSFGVGAMDDVARVRPRDIGSNTALHIIQENSNINIPTLEKLGLMNAIGQEVDGHQFSPMACVGTSDLTHHGADSFLGHQEIMGTTPQMPLIEPFQKVIDEVYAALVQHGYSVRYYGAADEPKILVVNDIATVGDNLETDYGQVYNVTGCLDYISFKELKAIGEVVRSVVKVSRVITFGGLDVTLDDLLNARRVKNNEIAGVDAPLSKVYNRGYQVIHLGYGIDKNVQIPTILDKAGITVSLHGKIADIVQTDSPRLFPGVDTQSLFDAFFKEVEDISHGFIALNIQETDLAGHAQDVMRYSDRLEVSDKNINRLLSMLNEEDILIVMADHGNDPTIGHSNHTRERVPLLVYGQNVRSGHFGNRVSMADVAATAAQYFNVSTTAHGESFLETILDS